MTKGPGGKLFPHHRGLYYGFNRISYDDGKKRPIPGTATTANFSRTRGLSAAKPARCWAATAARSTGMGRKGEVFAEELREMTAYNTPGGTLIEFASRLETKAGARSSSTAIRSTPAFSSARHRKCRTKRPSRLTTCGPTAKASPASSAIGRAGQGSSQSALERPVLRARRPAVHLLLPRPAAEPQGSPLQRARLRPVRLLLRIRQSRRKSRSN